MATVIQPTYITKQPSTGKSISFRPYTVKEEKALLLALQEEKAETISAAIKNLVDTWTSGTVDASTAPYYDIEYLFLQIRSKSVGEVIDLVGACECDPKAKTEFSIDIDSVKIEPAPQGTVDIRIPDTKYTVRFTHPSMDDFVRTYEQAGENAIEVVSNCIVSVFTDDEVLDWSKEEKLEFVESMTTRQQKDVAAFLKNMPMVKLPATYTCKACGKLHNKDLSGFSNFFV